MRTADEVEQFQYEARSQYVGTCSKCKGMDSACECTERYRVAVAAYEACVPQSFWKIRDSDIAHNKNVFKAVIKRYTASLTKARKNGYGLMLTGDNGVGKTTFLSYVLMEAIRRGFTAYYTTFPQMDADTKRGWKHSELEERLRWMLTSDWVAIDEMGKEKHKAEPGASYMGNQVERILKQRFDERLPTLIATNLDMDVITEVYGATIASMLAGRCHQAPLVPGDFRAKLQKKMVCDMGYGK